MATIRNVAALLRASWTLAFGLLSASIGVAIVAWVLYNHFVERQDSYTGHALLVSFGVGPALVGYGVSLVRSAVRPAVRFGDDE